MKHFESLEAQRAAFDDMNRTRSGSRDYRRVSHRIVIRRPWHVRNARKLEVAGMVALALLAIAIGGI